MAERGHGLAESTAQHMQRQATLLQELLEHFREKELGGRVFSCTTGSAPTAAEVLRWLDDVMGFPALNGYGSTECGVTILNNKVVAKWVPVPFPWVDSHLQCTTLTHTIPMRAQLKACYNAFSIIFSLCERYAQGLWEYPNIGRYHRVQVWLWQR